MSNNSNDYLSAVTNMKEDFVSYFIMAFIFCILIIIVAYIIYIRRLENSECDYMNTLYPSLDETSVRYPQMTQIVNIIYMIIT